MIFLLKLFPIDVRIRILCFLQSMSNGTLGNKGGSKVLNQYCRYTASRHCASQVNNHVFPTCVMPILYANREATKFPSLQLPIIRSGTPWSSADISPATSWSRIDLEMSAGKFTVHRKVLKNYRRASIVIFQYIYAGRHEKCVIQYVKPKNVNDDQKLSIYQHVGKHNSWLQVRTICTSCHRSLQHTEQTSATNGDFQKTKRLPQ